ncbi:MAG: class I SAM-dependent methyltransferase [Betaproteobacteria bacterium]|nr:class I SAM-dependent methyltransferase [Betaproteobacteria bacterium]
MDPATIAFYSNNAKVVARRYESVRSPLSRQFGKVFSPGGRILDIGCGSGRDMAELSRQGYAAYGVDASEELVQLAQEIHPELSGRVIQATLPDFDPPFEGGFDGVLCSAVLMHIATKSLLNSTLTMKRCLNANGCLLISVPKLRPDISEGNRDANGRLFSNHPQKCLTLILSDLGFDLTARWENSDSMERSGVEWLTLAFQLNSASLSTGIHGSNSLQV